MRPLLLAALGAIAMPGVAGLSATPHAPTLQRSAQVYAYRIVNSYPHDPLAYTQGLIYHDGFLYESTGLHGRSSLRKVRLETGEVLMKQAVDAQYFAEGLTLWDDRLIQLTWQAGMAFSYDVRTFARRQTFRYRGEGWGLTHDGRRLILSDGSNVLRFFDPATFKPLGDVRVLDGGLPVANLNELEYVDGEIYANVWMTDRIARIAPDTGRVVGWIDLTGLLPDAGLVDPDAVLNGIAFDPGRRRLFVTGKLWPRLFEIELTPRR